LLTTLAVLATANHFVLDVLAGLLTLAVAVAIAEASPRLLRPARSAVAHVTKLLLSPKTM
jgi:hypothetical protein